jgi:hypothetical protein
VVSSISTRFRRRFFVGTTTDLIGAGFEVGAEALGLVPHVHHEGIGTCPISLRYEFVSHGG